MRTAILTASECALIERLRNPTYVNNWQRGDSRLATEETLKDMSEAADMIERLSAALTPKTVTIQLTQELALSLLRMGQMNERQYLEHCEENGWPQKGNDDGKAAYRGPFFGPNQKVQIGPSAVLMIDNNGEPWIVDSFGSMMRAKPITQ